MEKARRSGGAQSAECRLEGQLQEEQGRDDGTADFEWRLPDVLGAGAMRCSGRRRWEAEAAKRSVVYGDSRDINGDWTGDELYRVVEAGRGRSWLDGGDDTQQTAARID